MNDPLNDPSGALQRLGAALNSGDRDSVIACFAADATLSLLSGEERIAFTSTGIREAVDTLMAGFDNIKLTPISRQVLASRVVQESVLSGDHTGSFCGAQPTSGRVRVNVKLSASGPTDSNLQSLWVEADTRALFAQIAGTDDIIGVTGGLIAAMRERHDGAVRLIEAASPVVVAAASTRTSVSHRRWPAPAAAAVLLLVVFLAWRPATAELGFSATADHPAKPETATSAPAVAPSPRAPAPSARTLRALPVIAIAAPNVVPHVQSGRQVVLNSDVLFGFNSAALTPAARVALTRVAQQVRSAGVTGTIQVNGYTDDLGGGAYDLALSRARALAVAGVLQEGLAGRPVALAPQGFGQVNPVVPNTSDRGRARNRRVTIVLPTRR
jgi:outer membrane protein OmpA-like peptidoglycan-associated protein